MSGFSTFPVPDGVTLGAGGPMFARVAWAACSGPRAPLPRTRHRLDAGGRLEPCQAVPARLQHA